jgi:hypothetical protein
MESEHPSHGYGAYGLLEDQPIFAIGPHTVLQRAFKHSDSPRPDLPSKEYLMKSMS